MPLTVGVLIIGSLLWDKDPVRETWRNNRLIINSAKSVTAPIRYGRLSSSRGNSYTMVFSRLCPVGQAKLVLCSHPISTVHDLVAEAEWLWKAEQPRARGNHIATDWGCVALLCNPEKDIPANLLKGWAERVAQESDYGTVSQTPEEGLLITNDGLLHIEWPKLVEGGEGADVHLLLVTANDPRITGTSPSYPSVEVVAEAWNNAGHNVEYFWNNTNSGICTFQDAQIRALLHPQEAWRR